MTAVAERLFRAVEVCETAGVTYRQVDYWSRLGHLWPTQPANGSGSQRLFDLREVQIAWALGQFTTGPGGKVPDAAPLRALPTFTGLAVCIGRSLTVVDIAEILGILAVEPVVTVVNLDACPIGEEDSA